jgi:hypothetical protein
MSQTTGTSGDAMTRWERTQMFVLDELPAVGIVVGAVAATASRIVPALGNVTVPAIVSVVVGVALRTLRIRYDLAGAVRHLDASLQQTREVMKNDVAQVSGSIGDLRNAVTSPFLHEAERCARPGFYQHMLSALEGATKTVDLTQLDVYPPTHYGTPSMVTYFNRQKQIVGERPSVQFRRIVAVPSLAKLEWLIDVLEGTANYANFQINVIELPEAGGLPAPLSLQIFDRRELCLVDPTLGSMRAGEQENMLWVAGEDVAQVFGNYYNDLWLRGRSVKEGGLIDIDVLNSLLEGLRAREPRAGELAERLAGRIDTLRAGALIRASG